MLKLIKCSEESAEWDKITSYLHKNLPGNGTLYTPVMRILANAVKPLRAAEILKESQVRGLHLSRTKLYDALKRYAEMGFVTRTPIQYPEGFDDWRRGRQRRWRSEHGYKKVPPLQFALNFDGLKDVLIAKHLAEIDRIRLECEDRVSRLQVLTNLRLDFIDSYTE